MPCSCAATKPCPLAASPRSWTNCANPASKMSAWLPSPSARARAPDEMTYELNHTAGPTLKVPLVFSLAFHSLLFGSLIVSTLLSHRGETWGGPGGGAMTVGLVGHLPGVPLPRPEAITPSPVVDETKGLYTAEPKPKPIETPAPTTPIPEFTRNKPPRYVTRPSRVLENPSPPPTNAVPYGQGGTPSLPYTQFTLGGATQGGMGFSGQGGDFGGHFPWYVQAVRNRIGSNWLQKPMSPRSEEHTSELQSRGHLVCRLLLEKKKKTQLKYI